MFVLRTGLQGHSKTLNTIKELDERSVKTGRPVYFHNIRGLQVDKLQGQWIPFDDPTKWYELPENSIAVIDEAQQFFGVRSNTSKVPLYASKLETMRHTGHELHCITQDPTFIDHHMRKLCNQHIHYNRPNKGKLISRWEFERPINPNNKSEFAQGECRVMKLDSSMFDKYQSTVAEHHFKWQPPRALFVLGGCILLLILGVWSLRDRFSPPAAEAAKVEQGGSTVPASAPTSSSEVHVMTPAEYADWYKPRVADFPSTAPAYDELTRPQSYPKPFCVATRSEQMISRNSRRMTIGYDSDYRLTGCRCNTQQGTRIDMTFDSCMSVVENGYFDPAKPDRPSAPVQGARASVADRDGLPAQPPAGERAKPWTVTVVENSEYKSRPWR